MVGSPFCSAINCHNSRKKNKGKSFFTFPLNEEVARRWVINARRKDLIDRDVKYLHANCALCSDHFEPKAFLNFERNRLHQGAVPTLFNIPNTTNTLASKKRKLDRTASSISDGERMPSKESVPDKRLSSRPVFNHSVSIDWKCVPTGRTYNKNAESGRREVAVQVDRATLVNRGTQTNVKLTGYSPRKHTSRRKTKSWEVSTRRGKSKFASLAT